MNEAEARAILQQADSQLVAAILTLVRREIARATGETPSTTHVSKLEGPLAVHGAMTFYPSDDPPVVGSVSEAVPTTQPDTIQSVYAFCQSAPAAGPLTAVVQRWRLGTVIPIASVTILAGSREGKAVPGVTDTRDGDWFWIEVTAADASAAHLAVALKLGVPVARG